MKQKVAAIYALLGPALAITVLSAVTWQLDAQRDLSFDAVPYAIWMLAMGILTALYLVVTLVLLPKHTSPALMPCAIVGAVLALILGVIDWFGFGIHLPIRLETLTTLNLTGLLAAGNLACAVLAARNRTTEP